MSSFIFDIPYNCSIVTISISAVANNGWKCSSNGGGGGYIVQGYWSVLILSVQTGTYIDSLYYVTFF